MVGGGRYDGLSELIGGPPTKGFGFALGLERLVLLLSGRSDLEAPYKPPSPDLFLAHVDPASFEHNLLLARELRAAGISVYLDLEGRSVKGQMRLANRLQSRFTCVVGETEMATALLAVRRMSDGTEKQVERKDLTDFLLKELK